MKVLAQKKYQDQIPCSFDYKLVCVDDRFSEPTLFTEVKTLLVNLLKQFLKNVIKKSECKKVMKKHFNKSLIIAEEEEIF